MPLPLSSLRHNSIHVRRRAYLHRLSRQPREQPSRRSHQCRRVASQAGAANVSRIDHAEHHVVGRNVVRRAPEPEVPERLARGVGVGDVEIAAVGEGGKQRGGGAVAEVGHQGETGVDNGKDWRGPIGSGGVLFGFRDWEEERCKEDGGEVIHLDHLFVARGGVDAEVGAHDAGVEDHNVEARETLLGAAREALYGVVGEHVERPDFDVCLGVFCPQGLCGRFASVDRTDGDDQVAQFQVEELSGALEPQADVRTSDDGYSAAEIGVLWGILWFASELVVNKHVPEAPVART